MSNKRRNSSSPECESPIKRQHQQPANSTPNHDTIYYDSDEIETNERPQVHAFTGQTGAFPGLSRGYDELFYGPAADGLDYLRMVRSEAKGIPSLLVAEPAESARIEEDDDGEEGGHWEEDAYIAAPREAQSNAELNLSPAQARYHEVLLAHYALIRATMKCVPPISAIEKLTSSQPISFPPESRKARYTWEQCLRTRDPSPTQIACMDESSIFELVKLVTKKMRGLFEKDDIEEAKRNGAWIWAVLGKCPDRGEMASEEISMLRDLARKAVDVRDWIMRKNRTTEAFTENEDSDDDGEGAAIGDIDKAMDSDIRAARTRLANNLEDFHQGDRMNEPDTSEQRYLQVQAAKQEKLVVLDMILTIISEFYGQRDLLEHRTIWEQDMNQV